MRLLPAVFAALLASPAFCAEPADVSEVKGSTRAAAPAEPRVSRTDIERLKRDPLYFGEEGFAQSFEAENKWDVMEKARSRALESLGRRIEVRIVSDIEDMMRWDGKDVDQKFQRKIRQYIDVVLESPEDTPYYDFPEKGDVTIVVRVKKSDYARKVKDDLNARKTAVRTHLTEGSSALLMKSYGFALTEFIAARAALAEKFPGISMREDLNGDGTDEDVSGYLNARIGEIAHNIDLSPVKDKLMFDVKGRAAPRVAVRYVGEGSHPPVAKVPLAVSFAKGEGRLGDASPATDSSGEAVLRVEGIVADPETKEAVLRVEIDGARLGLDKAAPLRPCTITLTKTKSLGYAVAGAKGFGREIEGEARRILAAAGYVPVAVSIKGAEASADEIQSAAAQNLDYLLVIRASASTSKMGDYPVYWAQAGAGISIYALPGGDLVADEELDPKEGKGAPVGTAAARAFAKLKPELSRLLKEKIGELK